MKDYKLYHKCGFGGIRCPCCNPLGQGESESKKRTKQFLNRSYRRSVRQNIRVGDIE